MKRSEKHKRFLSMFLSLAMLTTTAPAIYADSSVAPDSSADIVGGEISVSSEDDSEKTPLMDDTYSISEKSASEEGASEESSEDVQLQAPVFSLFDSKNTALKSSYTYTASNLTRINGIKISASNIEEGAKYYWQITTGSELSAEDVVSGGNEIALTSDVKADTGKTDLVCKDTPYYDGATFYVYLAVQKDGKSVVSQKSFTLGKISPLKPTVTVSAEGSTESSVFPVGTEVKITAKEDPKVSFDAGSYELFYTVNGGEETAYPEGGFTVPSENAGSITVTVGARLKGSSVDAALTNTAITFYEKERSSECSFTASDATTTFCAMESNAIKAYLDKVVSDNSANADNKVAVTMTLNSAEITDAGKIDIPSGIDMTVELNGNTMRFARLGRFKINKGASLTIKDSSENKTGSLYSGDGDGIVRLDDSTNNTTESLLKIEGGNYYAESGNIIYAMSISAKAEISGGYMETSADSGKIIYGSNNKNMRISISGGEFNAKGASGSVCQVSSFNAVTGSKLNISGGKLSSAGYVIQGTDTNAKNAEGVITVTGGEFKTSGKNITDGYVGSIEGGRFIADTTSTSEAFSYYGAIKTPEGKMLAYDSDEKCFLIKDLPDTVENGSVILIPADGNGNEISYTSVTEAFNAVRNTGGTIRLTSDVSVEGAYGLESSGNVTLDLNGKTLSVAPAITHEGRGCVSQSEGMLTLTDSSEAKSGKLELKGEYGITLTTGGNITVNGGNIKAESYGIFYNGAEKDSGNVTLNGGVLETSGYGVYLQDTDYGYGAAKIAFTMTGGEIRSGNIACFMIYCDSANITGGRLISSGETHAVALNNRSVSVISGDAEIETTANDQLDTLRIGSGECVIGGKARIYSEEKTTAIGCFNGAKLTIKEDARIEGGTTAVTLNAPMAQSGSLAIDGGHFKYGTVPFDESKNIEYKTSENDKYILSSRPNEDGEYAGYYDIALRSALSYKDENGIDRTYQELDDLVNIIKNAQAALADTSVNYTAESIEALQNALDAALPFVNINDDGTYTSANENANQAEIDYYTDQLTKARNELKGVSDIDPSDLADGVYSVSVSLLRVKKSETSMAAGAVDSKANVVVENGKAHIELNVQPMFQVNSWGHLLKLWAFNGANRAEGLASAAGGNFNDENILAVAAEASPLSYYTADSTLKDMKPYEGDDPQIGTNCYPWVLSVPLNYIDASSVENSKYSLRVAVDMMRQLNIGDQNVDLYVQWDTLTAVNVKPTVSLDVESAELIAGDSQTVTASLKYADGYALSWSSSDSNIATVTPAENNTAVVTAVSEGTCDITVTASKDGSEPVSKTFKVTVSPAGKTPVKVASNEVNNGKATAKLSGDTLTTSGSQGVTVNGDEVIINVEAGGSSEADINEAEIIIPDSVAEALKDRNATIKTDIGSVKLDSSLIGSIASVSENADDSVTVKISKTDIPNVTGSFIAAYQLGMTDKNGKDVAFGSGKATVNVPCSDDTVKYAYCVKDGKFTERVATVYNADDQKAAWTVSHFSVWALSAREYTVDSGNSGGNNGGGSGGGGGTVTPSYFLENGNYYVDIDLWKAASNEQSMGHVAFKNNGRALITVNNGKVTTVRIATNPVDVDQYHSAITKFEVENAKVTVTATDKVITKPAGKEYEYIKSVEFDMPTSGQPESKNEITYVPVTFWVPDTPMDAAVGEELDARIKFIWDSVSQTNDTEIKANTNSASGTSSITGKDIEDITLTDKATGIKLETNTERLDDKAVMTVTKLTSGSDYENAVKAMNGVNDKWNLYKIETSVNGKVTAPSGSVTLSFPCGTQALTVYRISDSGTKTALKGTVKNGWYVINTSSLGMFAVIGDISTEIPTDLAEGEFTDTQDHWAKAQIASAVKKGLFNGTSDTTFTPNASMNRAMFVTALGRLAKADTSGASESTFKDVKNGSWYAPYVAWAVKNGIVKGVSENEFAPEKAITRQEMAVLLSRYAEYANISLKKTGTSDFKDSSSISEWAKDAVTEMAEAGLIEGTGDGIFAPLKTATRAQVAVLLVRFAENYGL